MKEMYVKIKEKFQLSKIEKYALLVLGLFFVVFLSIISWKYLNFKYDELDLAIFNQTLFNTVNGQFFENTIQGQNYLGDHFTPLLVLLLPFYAIFKSPFFLLVVQLIGVIVGGWFFFLCAKEKLQNEIFAMLFLIAFVLNFSIQQIVLFGFHVLPFFFLTFFVMYYAYLKKNYAWYIVGIITCLLLREDVALVIAPFAMIPFLGKRHWKWWVMPLVSGIIYFPIAMWVISLFNQDGSYKFLQMYGWLGDSYGSIIKTIITQPLFVLSNLSWGSVFELLLGFLLPFFFIALLAARWFLVVAGILLLHILQASGIEQIILQTHYSVLIWPFIFLAAIEGFQKDILKKYQYPVLIIILVSSVYTAALLGPFKVFADRSVHDSINDTEIVRELLIDIPNDAGVIASSNLLPVVSSREHVYSAHYIFWGTKQFSEQQYYVDDSVKYMILNSNDFRFYLSQVFQSPESFNDGKINFVKFINERGFKITKILGDYVLLKQENSQEDNKEHVNWEVLGINSCSYSMKNEKHGYIPIKITFVSNPEEGKEVVSRTNLEDKNTPVFISFNYENDYFLDYGFEKLSFSKDNGSKEFTYWVPKNILEKNNSLLSFIQKKELSYFNYLGFIEFEELERNVITETLFNEVCLEN